jgi:hypothetical protein
MLSRPQHEEIPCCGIPDNPSPAGPGYHLHPRIILQLKAIARGPRDALQHVSDVPLLVEGDGGMGCEDRPALMNSPQEVIVAAFDQPISQRPSARCGDCRRIRCRLNAIRSRTPCGWVGGGSKQCGGVQTANATVYIIDTVMMPSAGPTARSTVPDHLARGLAQQQRSRGKRVQSVIRRRGGRVWRYRGRRRRCGRRRRSRRCGRDGR